MADKLTLRRTGTWAIICFGASWIGYWAATLVMAWLRARGGGVNHDEVAATTTLALKGAAVGIVILAIGIVARLILKPRAQGA